MVALSCHATPEEAARHGVFCLGDDGAVRLYLQKPALDTISSSGNTALDIGVMSFDAETAGRLLETLPAESLSHEVDLYREICCAMGSAATLEHYVQLARASGSQWSDTDLCRFFQALRKIPFHVQVVPQCSFLHFGSTRQLISSGLALAEQDHAVLSLNNQVEEGGSISGADSWVEGCRLRAPLALAGRNVVVGVDVDEPLSLPHGACLDVTKGPAGWFVRCCGVDDTFKDASFCGQPLTEWMAKVGAQPEERSDPWHARLFPAEREPGGYRRWLWMFDVDCATPDEKRAFLAADRYSAAQIAVLADQDAFHQRRVTFRAEEIRRNLARMFAPESGFSSDDLALALWMSNDRERLLQELLDLAGQYKSGLESFTFCRIVHTLGSVFESLTPEEPQAAALHAVAFERLNDIILASSTGSPHRPRNALRPAETIWGRAPARIELGGGWTDTPPYTLEYGGDVINAAVNLNGQPPIHCYGRVINEPVIRLSSFDGGSHIEIRDLAELLDYRRPEDRFALAKATLAISGFAEGETLGEMLEDFGGGVELTTLVEIPQGSGLGTSSILGAVILAVIARMTGRKLSQRELFHEVLRLEQALTTGGGWQDQVGGGVGGTKLTSTQPGLFPDPRIQHVPSDLLDPKLNGGLTLLYYTGLTRLAKNILQEIVGRYLDRDRAVMAALEEEHLVARSIADAMSRKDAAALGYYVNVAWELQKRLCGSVTNDAIESLLERVRPFVLGMRISGAGGGGFLLMIAKSPSDAARIREMLEREPLNEQARFFDFDVNEKGIEVTAC